MTAVEKTRLPTVGAQLGPERIHVDAARVRAYLRCVNDSTFSEHAVVMERHFGHAIAPATVLDGEMGSLIFRKRYGLLGDSLHAGQGFRFLRPLRVGAQYEMTAEVEDIYQRRGIEYVSVRSWCRDDDGEVCVTQCYLKALHVPTGRKGSSGVRVMSLRDFVQRHNGKQDARFPAIGAVVAGGARTVDETNSRDFSRLKDSDMPDVPNIHTDPALAERRGFERPIIKGLLATVSEAQLYRELFGPEWYTRGRLSTTYVRPIPVGANLEAVGIVTDSANGRITVASAVAADGVVVSVGEAGIE